MPDFRHAHTVFQDQPQDDTRQRLHVEEDLEPAVDRLHTVRQQIKDLAAEAAGLRQQILSGEVSAVGEGYVAKVRRRVTLIRRSQL